MNQRLLGFILFLLVATLLSALSAQAKQTMPFFRAHKLAFNRTAARLLHGRNRTRATRVSFFYPAPTTSEINTIVAGSANEFQVDPQLVQAIIQVESGYNTNAVSRKGARGLMQLIPETARRFGVKNAFNPGQNIHAGVGYLKHLLQLFSGDVLLSVAAYNAGEHAVMRVGKIPAYPETVDYVRKVAALYKPSLLATLVVPMPVLKS